MSEKRTREFDSHQEMLDFLEKRGPRPAVLQNILDFLDDKVKTVQKDGNILFSEDDQAKLNGLSKKAIDVLSEFSEERRVRRMLGGEDLSDE